MENIDWLSWNIEYARKEQIKRLTEHLDKGESIGSFLNEPGEWQIDSLIRYGKHYIPKIQEDLEKKPNKLLFWKKFL